MEAQDGNRHSMDELVRRWQKRLWLHALRLTMSADAAWYITQQAWLAIIKGLARLHDPARFRPWAYRITTNKAMDYLKAASARRLLPEQPIEDTRVHDEGGPLVELLNTLDHDQRAVLVLYYVEGLSVADVGFVLGIPEGTVKSRLHNARAELRRRWERELGESPDAK